MMTNPLFKGGVWIVPLPAGPDASTRARILP